MQPSPSQVKAQIFVAVAAALINKWPAREESDHKIITRTTAKLTNDLYEKYLENPSNEELLEE